MNRLLKTEPQDAVPQVSQCICFHLSSNGKKFNDKTHTPWEDLQNKVFPCNNPFLEKYFSFWESCFVQIDKSLAFFLLVLFQEKTNTVSQLSGFFAAVCDIEVEK